MALTTTVSSTAANTRRLQDLKKCKYCDYEHWDEFDLRFHEEMHEEYCKEKRLKRKNVLHI